MAADALKGPNPYAFDGSKKANADALNAVTADIALRLSAMEGLAPSIEAAKDSLVSIGLDRLNTQLLPTIQVEQARVERGVLIAASTTPVTLTVGAEVDIVVDEADWLSFSPSSLVALTRTSTTRDYATLQTIAWDRSVGLFRATILAVSGFPGPWADWQLGSQAGSTTAQLTWLAAGQAAASVAAEAEAATAADRHQTGLDAAATAADRAAVEAAIGDGPVLSVAGRTGAVTLSVADVAGAASALSVTTAIGAVVASLQAELDPLAASAQQVAYLLCLSM